MTPGVRAAARVAEGLAIAIAFGIVVLLPLTLLLVALGVPRWERLCVISVAGFALGWRSDSVVQWVTTRWRRR